MRTSCPHWQSQSKTWIISFHSQLWNDSKIAFTNIILRPGNFICQWWEDHSLRNIIGHWCIVVQSFSCLTSTRTVEKTEIERLLLILCIRSSRTWTWAHSNRKQIMKVNKKLAVKFRQAHSNSFVDRKKYDMFAEKTESDKKFYQQYSNTFFKDWSSRW